MGDWEPVKCLIPQRLHNIGKTQRWLANVSGDSEKTVSHYVTLHRLLGMKKAKKYASILKCRIDDLYEWRYEDQTGE